MAAPTPEEAQRALRDVETRKQQSLEGSRSSRWWWIGGGVAVIAYGFVGEFASDFIEDWGATITGVLLLLAVLSTTRWGGSLLGRRTQPRRASASRQLGLGLIGAVGALAIILVAQLLDVPHLALGLAIVGGLLLAFVGPWWEGRVLAHRGARG
ncbi:hypothetical protein [Cryptosporangium sp. NPDC048952]|uniref:hypothetical protein n=1 Tax=Cryptosporangium sp. NPDC048952 TaxID=3363961 RepID=UPI003718FFDD